MSKVTLATQLNQYQPEDVNYLKIPYSVINLIESTWAGT